MNKNKRNEILCRLQSKNNNPKTELIYNSPFELLIATFLSTKTSDKIVNKITQKLFAKANNPQDILKLGINNIKLIIQPIGFFKKKAEAMIKICYILLKKYQGKIPEDQEALKSLPGVGNKVSSIILNTIFSWPLIAVDTHVFRVCNRTYFAIGKNVKIIEYKLSKLVPKKFKINCHNLLLLHGKYVCTSRFPKCNVCIISDLCEFKNKNY